MPEISDLPVVEEIDGTEYVPLIKGGTTYRALSANIGGNAVSVIGALEQVDAGATETITFAAKPSISIDLSTNLTLDFDGTAPLLSYKLFIYQDVAGDHTVTWPTSGFSWYGGIAPFINTAPSSLTIVEITSLDGGATFVGVGQQVDPNNPANQGIQATFPVLSAQSSQALNGTGVLMFTYYTAAFSGHIDRIRTYVGATVAATITRTEVGVIEVADPLTGTLGDRLATSGAGTTLWATTSQAAHVASLGAGFDQVAGVRYAVGFLMVGTTMPTLLGWLPSAGTPGNAVEAMLNGTGDRYRRCGHVGSQTDIPADCSALVIAKTPKMNYAELYAA